jgi:hypothetical protein
VPPMFASLATAPSSRRRTAVEMDPAVAAAAETVFATRLSGAETDTEELERAVRRQLSQRAGSGVREQMDYLAACYARAEAHTGDAEAWEGAGKALCLEILMLVAQPVVSGAGASLHGLLLAVPDSFMAALLGSMTDAEADVACSPLFTRWLPRTAISTSLRDTELLQRIYDIFAKLGPKNTALGAAFLRSIELDVKRAVHIDAAQWEVSSALGVLSISPMALLRDREAVDAGFSQMDRLTHGEPNPAVALCVERIEVAQQALFATLNKLIKVKALPGAKEAILGWFAALLEANTRARGPPNGKQTAWICL